MYRNLDFTGFPGCVKHLLKELFSVFPWRWSWSIFKKFSVSPSNVVVWTDPLSATKVLCFCGNECPWRGLSLACENQIWTNRGRTEAFVPSVFCRFLKGVQTLSDQCRSFKLRCLLVTEPGVAHQVGVDWAEVRKARLYQSHSFTPPSATWENVELVPAAVGSLWHYKMLTMQLRKKKDLFFPADVFVAWDRPATCNVLQLCLQFGVWCSPYGFGSGLQSSNVTQSCSFQLFNVFGMCAELYIL